MADVYSQIGRGVRSVADYDRQAVDLENARLGAEQNRMALMLNRQKADEYGRGVAEQNRMRELTRTWGADTTDDQRIASLKNAGFFGQADALEKGMLERQKTGAEVSAKGADVRAKEYDLQRKRYEHRIQGLSQFSSPEDVRQWLADGVMRNQADPDDPYGFSFKEAGLMMNRVPSDPAALEKWKQDTIFSLQDSAKQAGYFRPDANAVLSAKTSAENNAADNARIAAEGAANRGVQMRGQDTRKEKKAVGKPMPAAALKLQQEALDAIGISKAISADMDSLIAQLSPSTNAAGAEVPPALRLGPVENLMSAAKNATGLSDQNSKNYNSAKATMEKLRNDSLRLNKGVQTEGDSQRAWNELLANMNDQENVKQRLSEIRDINERAALLHQANVDVVRQNYGLEPLDMDAYLKPVPVVGAKKGAKPAAINPLGASSRVGGQAPRPVAAPVAPAAVPKFLGFEPTPGG